MVQSLSPGFLLLKASKPVSHLGGPCLSARPQWEVGNTQGHLPRLWLLSSLASHCWAASSLLLVPGAPRRCAWAGKVVLLLAGGPTATWDLTTTWCLLQGREVTVARCAGNSARSPGLSSSHKHVVCLLYISALPMVLQMHTHFTGRKTKARDLAGMSKKSNT